MIELNAELYIGEGAERKAFFHPLDHSKLIKIEYISQVDRDQNNLDIYYYNYLKKKNISYKHISKCYGTIQTNLGDGVIFEVIKNNDGSLSQTFEEIVLKNHFSQEQETQLLQELEHYLLDNTILFGDVVLSNLLCQKVDSCSYKLVIIDGLGARRFGFKLWLHMHSKLYTKYRMKKQWKKLLFNYQELRDHNPLQ